MRVTVSGFPLFDETGMTPIIDAVGFLDWGEDKSPEMKGSIVLVWHENLILKPGVEKRRQNTRE